jgi:hypothetical protein
MAQYSRALRDHEQYSSDVDSLHLQLDVVVVTGVAVVQVSVTQKLHPNRFYNQS